MKWCNKKTSNGIEHGRYEGKCPSCILLKEVEKECNCGHVCTSGCQKDFDCPCLENCGYEE